VQGDGEVLDPMSKDEESDDVAVARFLRTCPGLSKSIVGDLLGQNNERCLRILDSFTHMFDFSGQAISRNCKIDLESAFRCLCELVHLTPRAHSPHAQSHMHAAQHQLALGRVRALCTGAAGLLG